MEADKLKELVLRALDTLKDLGLAVAAMTGWQGTDYNDLLSSLDVTPQRPYFLHREEKIHCFVDPPHLLDTTRRTLMKCNVDSSTGLAEWAVVKKLFDISKRKREAICSKLAHQDFHSSLKPQLKRAIKVGAILACNFLVQ